MFLLTFHKIFCYNTRHTTILTTLSASSVPKSVTTEYQIMKQEHKTQIDASKINHCQKTAKQQKAFAAIIAEKKTQLKTAENTAMGYHEMLQKISKEVADAHCCARDHQEKLSKTEICWQQSISKKCVILKERLLYLKIN
jgi:hypothetical protein